MKTKYRKDLSSKKRDLIQNGGGPATVAAVEEDPYLADIVAPSVTPLQNPYDGDAHDRNETVRFK